MNLTDAADIIGIPRNANKPNTDQDLRDAAEAAAQQWGGTDATEIDRSNLRLAFYDGAQYGLRMARRDER